MIHIEEYKPGEEKQIEEMIRAVYDEFVAPDYSDEGNKHFYEFIIPENISERVGKGHKIFIAKDENHIIGMIELKEYHHICLLFVDKQYHGRGVAKELFYKVTALAKENSSKNYIDVHSSPYAVPVYEKLGFRTISGLLETDGIKFYTMQYEL